MNDEPLAPYLTLVDTLIRSWSDLTVLPAEGSTHVSWVNKRPVPQRAYLLFNRWAGNPLAQSLAAGFPKWAVDRFPVPDRQFEDRTEHAPFILELPEELILAKPDSSTRAIREWLASCLESAARQVSQRISRQDFCGIVISPEPARTIVRHWVGLGDQRPPYEDESVLFRYHDPRVMQRVWPALSASQQSRWLGPVTQWWSLRQPWGPFVVASEPVQWFHAKTPVLPHGVPPGGSPRDLFDEAQWFLSGVSPEANTIWLGYADSHVPPEAQPDAQSLLQMMADAHRLGLGDLNVEDYVWVTWMHAPRQGPVHAMDWNQPHLASILDRVLAWHRDHPDERFSTLVSQFIKFQKKKK